MDQREIAVYVKARCRHAGGARRLFRHRGYAFEVIDVSGDDGLRNWLIESHRQQVGSPGLCRQASGARLRQSEGTRYVWRPRSVGPGQDLVPDGPQQWSPEEAIGGPGLHRLKDDEDVEADGAFMRDSSPYVLLLIVTDSLLR